MTAQPTPGDAPRPPAVIILAAGRGVRMQSARPKALQPVAGRAMIHHVLDAALALNPDRVIVVIGPDMPELAAAVAPHDIAVQQLRRGTADAARAGAALLGAREGPVLILLGDVPLIRPGTLRRTLDALSDGAAAAVLGFDAPDPAGYGRMLTDPDGALTAIVEDKDADPAQRQITLCNSGVMALDAARALPLLDRIGDDNAAGEYYLTDIVALARRQGLCCAAVRAPATEVTGVNSRADLARVEALWQQNRRADALAAGVYMPAPETVWFAHDTVLEAGCVVEPYVVFAPGVHVAAGATVRAFSHLEGARLETGAAVGPFARLRPGAVVGPDARVGNFVEMKNSRLEKGAKAGHLSYLGDAHIGAGANIGAGTITCNYDGVAKHRTEIGAGAFIGSNSALVAPVSIGAGALVGAGSVITRDVAPDALALSRAGQMQKDGVAALKRRDGDRGAKK